MATDLQERVTGVLVFDGEPELAAVQDPSVGGGVVVFDGRPTVGAVSHYVPAGVTVTATTGPRGAKGDPGAPGFVIVAPGDEPDPDNTADMTWVFEGPL